MARLNIPLPEEAPTGSQPILAAIGEQVGMVPNILRLLSLSPVALLGFAGLQQSLAEALDPEIQNAVALAVSEANGSD